MYGNSILNCQSPNGGGQIRAAVFEKRLYSSCSYIGPKSTFHGRPCFPHGIHSIFISNNAVIGKDCVIFQQVTIGSNLLVDSKNNGSPTIGDNCYIGCGAKVIGNVKVGNNVRIGANAVVTKDVPDNSVVVAFNKVITKEECLDNRFFYQGRNNWYVWTGGKYVEAVNDIPCL